METVERFCTRFESVPHDAIQFSKLNDLGETNSVTELPYGWRYIIEKKNDKQKEFILEKLIKHHSETRFNTLTKTDYLYVDWRKVFDYYDLTSMMLRFRDEWMNLMSTGEILRYIREYNNNEYMRFCIKEDSDELKNQEPNYDDQNIQTVKESTYHYLLDNDNDNDNDNDESDDSQNESE